MIEYDAYLAQSLRCAAKLIAQGVDDQLLLRAWRAYMLVGPPDDPAPSPVEALTAGSPVPPESGDWEMG